jgi:hypothetical protein
MRLSAHIESVQRDCAFSEAQQSNLVVLARLRVLSDGAGFAKSTWGKKQNQGQFGYDSSRRFEGKPKQIPDRVLCSHCTEHSKHIFPE